MKIEIESYDFTKHIYLPRFYFLLDEREKKRNIINLNTVNVQEWVKDPQNVYIGRKHRLLPASIWGNPYKMREGYSRDEVVKLFEKYFLENDELREMVRELKGKTLGCWCSPKPCHGEILHRFAGNYPIYG